MISRQISATSPCPCCSTRIFADCCEPILNRPTTAETAEQIMRARFTAYVIHRNVFLRETAAPHYQHWYNDKSLDESCSEWSRLEVLKSTNDANGVEAEVSFVAYYFENGTEKAHHERSLFRRVNGCWIYWRVKREGPEPYHRVMDKVGRNELCPCGSGQKFKRCCQR